MYTISVRRPQPHNTNLQTERREREKEQKTIVGIEQLRPIKKHGPAFETRQSHTIEYAASKILPEGHRKGNKSPAVLQGSAARLCISVSMYTYALSQPVAKVLAYLHVQISPTSCNVIGSILSMCLEKTLTQQLQATSRRGWRGTTPCTINWCKKVRGA